MKTKTATQTTAPSVLGLMDRGTAEIVSMISTSPNYDETEAMPNGPQKAIEYAIHGLLTDGGHHKQWILEEVLKALGVNLDELRVELQTDGYDWEPGIPP